MREDFTSLAQITSARQMADYEKSCRVREQAIRAENERKRKVDDATIELNEYTKKQNEILKAQLAETQKANELLVTQAKDSARLARISLVVAIVSAIGTVLSLVIR